MSGSQRRPALILAVALGLLAALVVAFLVGRQFPAGSGTASPGATSSSPLSNPTSGSSPGARSTSSSTSALTGSGPSSSANPTSPSSSVSFSPSASVSGRPGDNAFAAAGNGPSQARFTAAGASWQLHVTYDCPNAGTLFTVTVNRADGSSVEAIRGGGRGDDSRIIPGGSYLLTVSGACRWTLEATG